jgi:hypothetical protein
VKRRLISAISGTLTLGSLIDMRAVDAWLTYEQMTRVTSRAEAIAQELEPRGPVAIVVANQALVPSGQTHAVVRSRAGTAGFFRDVETAERWLDTEASN